MKNRLTTVVGLCTLLAFAGCKKDEVQTVLQPNAAPQLTASATTATIAAATANTPAVTYTWTAADFNYQAAVTYTLQFAKKGTNFAAPQEFNLGSALSKSFTQKELNDVYNNIDCNLVAPVPVIPLDVRVIAKVGDAVSALTSSVSGIAAVPYPAVTLPTDQWGLVGPAGDGWPGATNTDRLMPYDCRVRSYVLRMPLNAGPFKFRKNQDWGTNLGGVTGDYTKGVPLTKNGADLVIATAGTYTVSLQVNTDAAGNTVDGKVTITP